MVRLPGVCHYADALLPPQQPADALPALQPVLAHEYILPAGLPPLSRIAHDAQAHARRSCHEQVRADSLAEAMAEDMPGLSVPEHREDSLDTDPQHSAKSAQTQLNKSSAPVQPYELLRAIERKDLQLIFRVRDSQFSLLVQQRQGVTPLLYAMRLGTKYRDIAILLTGALSRYVNSLPESETPTKSTRETLKQVRANLKLAITASLEASQTDLISSYLQVLVMSEGERWILEKSHITALAIRSGHSSAPVHTAKQSVMHFATAELKQLRKEYLIASVEDYVSNATIDLLLMGTWELVLSYVDPSSKDTLPTYHFGRDDRMFQSFRDRIATASNNKAYSKIPKNIRLTVTHLLNVAGKHTISFGQKVEELRQELDLLR